MTILLVDADPDTRFILRSYLEPRGYTVLVAADGEEGLRLARDHRPDVVVGEFPMDVPGHSPFIDALRTESGCAAPILAFTARARKRDVEDARAVADAVLTKPAPPSAVLDTIERLLGKRG